MKTSTGNKKSPKKPGKKKKRATKIIPDNPNHREDFEWLLEKMVTPPDSK